MFPILFLESALRSKRCSTAYYQVTNLQTFSPRLLTVYCITKRCRLAALQQRVRLSHVEDVVSRTVERFHKARSGKHRSVRLSSHNATPTLLALMDPRALMPYFPWSMTVP